MQIEIAGGGLGETAAGDGQPRDRTSAEISQRAANNVADVDQRVLRKVVGALHGALRGETGRCGDIVETAGEAMMNINMRQQYLSSPKSTAPDDPEPRVHGLLGEKPATGDRDCNGHVWRRRATLLGRVAAV